MLGDAQQDALLESEFADEYQELLLGTASEKRAGWFDYPVNKLAREEALCVPGKLSVLETTQRMAQQGTGSALITDRGGLVGIFTERDLLERVVSAGLDPKNTAIESVMTKAPDALPISASIAQALRFLSHGHYRHAPLVDERNVPVGMLSTSHLVGVISETFPKEILNSPPETETPDTPKDEDGA